MKLIFQTRFPSPKKKQRSCCIRAGEMDIFDTISIKNIVISRIKKLPVPVFRMKFILKKIGTLIITLVIISFLSFLAFSLIPGDAAVASLGMDADEAAIEALREELGLNGLEN